MAVEGNKENIIALSAATDLSAKQYRFVKMTGNWTVGIVTAATDCPVGVLDNNPLGTAGKPLEATVSFKGVTKIVLGGTVAAGDRVGSDNTGAAVKLVEGTDTTKYEAGVMMEAGVAGEVRSMLLFALPHRAS